MISDILSIQQDTKKKTRTLAGLYDLNICQDPVE